MATVAAPVTNSPADILKYQNDLVRTGEYFPLGRMKQIAIAPCAGWTPRQDDPFIKKFGRLIDLRNAMLPIAQTRDRSMVLVTSPLLNPAGRVQLPDVPVPDWVPPPLTEEEIAGRVEVDPLTGKERRVLPKLSNREPAMIPQDLRDRTNEQLRGSNFLVFSPVVNVTFQPELDREMQGTAWILSWRYNPADDTHPTLLIDERTGETHFYGGAFEIVRPGGE